MCVCVGTLVRTHTKDRWFKFGSPHQGTHTNEKTSGEDPDVRYSFSNQIATPTAIKQISVSKLLNAT